MSYVSASNIFQIILLGISLTTYVLLVFWIIPQYVKEDRRELAVEYTGYSIAIVYLVVAVTSKGAEILDGKSAPTSGGKRKQ